MLKLDRAGWVVGTMLMLVSAKYLQSQAVTPVPTLDLRQISGVWYEVARLPDKREKHCARDVTKLIGLGDKARTLQIVDSCTTKEGYDNVSNATAKQDKRGNGELKSGYWPFQRKLWILALAPDHSWAIAGSPNHKKLVILSRDTTLDPAKLSTLESNAAAMGFRSAKLSATAQDGK